jgi:hypothetical protein
VVNEIRVTSPRGAMSDEDRKTIAARIEALRDAG